MIKLPANGSRLANCLLVGCGMLVGGTFVWVAHPRARTRPEALAHEPAALRASSGGAEERATLRTAAPPTAAATAVSEGPNAVTVATSLLDPRERARALHDLGAALARTDLEQALREAMNLERPQDRLDFLRGVFGVWAESDPEAALAYARRNLAAGMIQTEMISLAVNKWGATNPHDAWVWVSQNLSGPLREQALTDLMIGWTRRDPAGAAAWLASTAVTSQALYAATATTWAEQDRHGALDWADRLKIPHIRSAALTAAVLESARQDPAETAQVVTPKLESEPNAPELATVLADVWGTDDPAATARWVETLPPGPVREQAAGTLANVWATQDIEGAIAWSASLEDSPMRRQVIAHLGTVLGALEPNRAIAWLATLSPVEAAGALDGTFNAWAATDAVGLYQWIADAPNTLLADQARRSLGDVITQEDMFGAMDLALTIQSDALRENTLARYFRLWQRQDPASADEWMMLYGPTLDGSARVRLQAEQKRGTPPRE